MDIAIAHIQKSVYTAEIKAFFFWPPSDYSPPPGVLNFFLCFSTSEWVAIARYLGFSREELDPILEEHQGNNEQQVISVHGKYMLIFFYKLLL